MGNTYGFEDDTVVGQRLAAAMRRLHHKRGNGEDVPAWSWRVGVVALDFMDAAGWVEDSGVDVLVFVATPRNKGLGARGTIVDEVAVTPAARAALSAGREDVVEAWANARPAMATSLPGVTTDVDAVRARLARIREDVEELERRDDRVQDGTPFASLVSAVRGFLDVVDLAMGGGRL